MNAAHGHPRGHATCSYELGSCPRLPRLTHAASAAPAEQERLRLSPPSSRSRTISFAPRKGAAMAMAALRGASRCLAPRGSAVAARPMLLAHSRGITYKLFIGGWLLTLIARVQPPPLLTNASASSVERSVPSRASRCWGGKHICCVAPRSSPGPACLVFDGMSVQARRLDAVF